jgi:tRNA pseudouridine55 synthase
MQIPSTGILLVDKPSGMTSHDVVNYVRRQTGIKRVGHAGTLDPLATGLLIILIGRAATKQQAHFLHQSKEYLCQAQLGLTTDSYDSQGKVVASVPFAQQQKFNRERLIQVLPHFTGKILQTVPAFSAVKVKGQKLYQKARQGQLDLQSLPSRTVEISELELLDFRVDHAQQRVTFTVHVACSSGTYIRSLIHDIGQVLKVGATVIMLRRTKIGDLRVEDALKIE